MIPYLANIDHCLQTCGHQGDVCLGIIHDIFYELPLHCPRQHDTPSAYQQALHTYVPVAVHFVILLDVNALHLLSLKIHNTTSDICTPHSSRCCTCTADKKSTFNVDIEHIPLFQTTNEKLCS